MIAVANFIGLPLLFLSTTMIARAQMPRLDAGRGAVQPGRLGREGGARGRAARHVWGAVGCYLCYLLAAQRVTAAWATWTFRAYQRSL